MVGCMMKCKERVVRTIADEHAGDLAQQRYTNSVMKERADGCGEVDAGGAVGTAAA